MLFAKRTHRFLTEFLMEHSLTVLVASELLEQNRWVRFRKRTHREGYCRRRQRRLVRLGFGGVRLPRQLLRGISSDSVWKTNPKMGGKTRVSSGFDPLLGRFWDEGSANMWRHNGDLRSNNVRGRETGAQWKGRMRPRRSVALHGRHWRYRWALDTLAGGDIVELESDKNCRI